MTGTNLRNYRKQFFRGVLIFPIPGVIFFSLAGLFLQGGGVGEGAIWQLAFSFLLASFFSYFSVAIFYFPMLIAIEREWVGLRVGAFIFSILIPVFIWIAVSGILMMGTYSLGMAGLLISSGLVSYFTWMIFNSDLKIDA